jgi:hypothetical protein
MSARLAAMPDMPDALIQMRRAGCAAGPCPSYALSIFADGTVTYDGRVNVAVVGQRRIKVSADQVSGLIATIEAMHFLDSAERCCVCPEGTTSQPVILDYRPGSAQKTVVHDEACPSAPQAMGALEQAIDRVAGVGRWTAPVLAREDLTASQPTATVVR